jgi:hypothetical protein
MAPPKRPRGRRLLRNLAITVVALVMFVLLFIAAFVFNPFEGSLASLRDAVPRGVNFFVLKEGLADDFEEFPKPKFWSEVTEARGFDELAKGPLGDSWRKSGLEGLLDRTAATLTQVRTDTGGFLDPMRDVLGRQVIVAGYQQDYSQSPPRPLGEPWWCVYARVTWRVKALHGLAGFGLVQGQLRQNGIEVSADGDDLMVKLPGAPQALYVRRHLDLLMVSNHKPLIEQSQRLLDGNRDEEPIGQMAAYTDGAQKRIERWARVNAQDPPNVVEFVLEPNAFDWFRRHAASWPNPQEKDSMNERVLASFLNLKGWQQVTGGVMFADRVIAATGQVGLNSKQHTPFQASFYREEQEQRARWLDPFLRMVPETACAAAALRMPVGEYMHAMFDALDDRDKEILNDAVRRTTFQGTNVADFRDLIERLKLAFLPRTGFVFRRNEPDLSRDEKGELAVPVTARSPIPQIAWVFWLRPNGGDTIATELVTLLRTYASTFQFRKVWNLPVAIGSSKASEPVWEFTNPQIPGTGEIAMIVFRDFFVLSNSGPLIRDILRTRHSTLTGVRSIRDVREDFDPVEAELSNELNALVWLHGPNLVKMLDDYLGFAQADSERPDAEWMMTARPGAEDHVRRTQFARYPSVAAIPKSMTEPGGEFDAAVVAHMREEWRKVRTSFTADDRARMLQLKGMAQLLQVGAIQLELQNSYIRYQARLALARK